MRRGTPAAIEFGQILSRIRTDKKMTMRHVASILGVYPANISQIEKGQRALKEDKIAKWAVALETDEGCLRGLWLSCQSEPDPPIVRKRRKTVEVDTLYSLISKLSSTDRDRVLGYVEALMESKGEL